MSEPVSAFAVYNMKVLVPVGGRKSAKKLKGKIGAATKNVTQSKTSNKTTGVKKAEGFPKKAKGVKGTSCKVRSKNPKATPKPLLKAKAPAAQTSEARKKLSGGMSEDRDTTSAEEETSSEYEAEYSSPNMSEDSDTEASHLAERKPKISLKRKNSSAFQAEATLREAPQAKAAKKNVGSDASERSKDQTNSETLSPESNVVTMDSYNEGRKLFRWLINPVNVDDFYVKYWERNICLVKRKQPDYYRHLISFEAIDQMLVKNHVMFSKHLDLTLYENGIRTTLNPEGRALPPAVWEHYGKGGSIRLLNPQIFMPTLYTLSATLQEYFHCLVGANVYLTPPDSQGFAPHYDDIEAFVLQVEGCKRWKLYEPKNKSEFLPRHSSQNFKQNEIGKPILEEVLRPGDILYFPRGTIHQAYTERGSHSLHITLSVYQNQAYADLFETMMPLILQNAVSKNLDMRRGLPLNTWHNAGIAFSDYKTPERKQLMDKVTQLLSQCIRDTSIEQFVDAAVDQMAKKYQREALPPDVLPAERARTIFGSKTEIDRIGDCLCDYDIDLHTKVRLLRANIVRLVREEEKERLYYYLNNTKQYCEYGENFIDLNSEDARSVEMLIHSYPAYISASQLPLKNDERKISVITALWETGVLMLEEPLDGSHDIK